MTDAGLRRSERAVTDRRRIESIIRSVTICRVGFADRGEPYVVPVNFGWEPGADGRPDRFWFHSATVGRKAQLIAGRPRVCVQLDADLDLITHYREACAWSQAYRSVMAWGPARAARDRAEARHGLDVIMRRHSDRDGWTYPDKVLDHTLVWCVEVERLTAKEHRPEAADA